MQEYYARLAQVESGGNPLARNPVSSAKGMFQFVDDTAKQYGITAPFGTPEYAKQEIDAVQRFTADNKAKLTEALGREPSMGELYLAHQQGAGGALKLLQNPQAKAADLVGRDAVVLNAGNPDVTAQEFAMNWQGKFGDAPQEAPKVQVETFDVELPDGTVLEGIPLGTTKEQIKAKLAAGGYDVAKLGGEQAKAETAPQEAPQEERSAGFVQRMEGAVSDRFKNLGEIARAYDEQTLPETAAQVVGQGFGAFGDLLGNALISGYRYLPESDAGLGEGAAALGAIPTGEGQTLKDTALGALQNVMSKYGEFRGENPRLARNLEAVGNIGTALLPAKGVNVVGKTGTAAGKSAKYAKSVLDDILPPVNKITADQIKANASSFYKVAEQAGGAVSPSSTVKIYDDIVKKISEEGATLPEATKEALRKVADPEGVVRQATEVFSTLKGQPLSLEGFQTIDKTLGDLAYKASTPDDVSRKVLTMQRTLRDTVENITEKDLIGGAAGFEAYKRGREIWAKSARMRDLEQITAKAFATQQPTSSLKGGLKRFLADKDNLRGFSADEIKAIENAAETGVVTEMIRGGSSRLLGIGAGVTNPAMAPLAVAGSAATRSMSETSMLRKMQEINNLIATGQANRQGFIVSGGRLTSGVLGRGGNLIEKAYSGQKSQLGNLGLLQELQREIERNQQGE